MDTLRSLVTSKPATKPVTKVTTQSTTTMTSTTSPPHISLSPLNLNDSTDLNITSPSATQGQFADLPEHLQIVEDALENPLHTDTSFHARILKLEQTIGGLTEGVQREEVRNQKLDHALPKIANAVGNIHDDVEVLKREVERLKKALKGMNGKTGGEGSKGEKGAGSGEDEEGGSFASAADVAIDEGIKKEQKLKHMDHGGRADRIVRTVFEEIDYGHEVEYKKISQELSKD